MEDSAFEKGGGRAHVNILNKRNLGESFILKVKLQYRQKGGACAPLLNWSLRAQ